jgi:hypothetical protein
MQEQTKLGDDKGTAGQALEKVDFQKVQQACWTGFVGSLNFCIKNNLHTDKLVINYQGQDCRITECQIDGTCQIDMPGGDRNIVALRPEDCTRLQAVMCDVPPAFLADYAQQSGGQHGQQQHGSQQM